MQANKKDETPLKANNTKQNRFDGRSLSGEGGGGKPGQKKNAACEKREGCQIAETQRSITKFVKGVRVRSFSSNDRRDRGCRTLSRNRRTKGQQGQGQS